MAKKTCSPRIKKFRSPMLSEHISGASSTVFSHSSTGNTGLPPVVSWITASVSAHNLSCNSASISESIVFEPSGFLAWTCRVAAPAIQAATPCSTISSSCSRRLGFVSLPWIPSVRAHVMITGSPLLTLSNSVPPSVKCRSYVLGDAFRIG